MSSIEKNDYYSIIKKIFDEIDEVILKSHERNNIQTIPNFEDNYDDVTHDQRDKSIVNLVDASADDELLPKQEHIADGVVKNKKDENDNICIEADLPSQETMISDLSDDESSPKKPKQFTFTDSDLPDSEEIEEFLKAYPRPQVTYFPWIESESKSYSDEEDNWLSRRRRKKMKPVTIKITIEKLPKRFLTRQRTPNTYLVTKKDCYRVLQSGYLKKHEDQIDEEIIRENIKRLKTSNKNKMPESKDTKSKSFAINNITHNIISIVKTTTRRTRYMKIKGEVKNNKIKSISSAYYKNNYKRKCELKKERSTLSVVEGRRSKRNQKTKEKDEDTMKAPVSVPKSEAKKNKNISPGNNKTDFIRKRALKKERSTLPALEGRRSKRNQKIKEKDEDTMEAPVSVPKSEAKNNKNKNISPGNNKNDFIRKRALKKERSTLPAVEGRRSKRSQKIKEKEEDTMKAPVSVPKSEAKNNKNISPGNDKNDFIRKRALKKERSTLPAVEGRRSKRNQKIKEKIEDTMKAPVSVPKSEAKNNKNIFPGNDKNDFIRKRALKQERSTLPAVEGRRSKRNQKIKEKDEATMKAPVSVPKNKVHEQRRVYNISSSSSKSSKRLKRSLVEDSDVPFPKRTRLYNNKVTNAPTSVRPTKKIQGLEPDKPERNTPARRGRKAA